MFWEWKHNGRNDYLVYDVRETDTTWQLVKDNAAIMSGIVSPPASFPPAAQPREPPSSHQEQAQRSPWQDGALAGSLVRLPAEDARRRRATPRVSRECQETTRRPCAHRNPQRRLV